MMKVPRMRSLASIVLSAVALAQMLLLMSSAGFIVFRLQDVESEVARLGREEQLFLDRLSAVEADLYRISIAIRDSLATGSRETSEASRELTEMLTRVSSSPLVLPAGSPLELRDKLARIESARMDYLNRARTILSWSAEQRLALGRNYVTRELAPTRLRFTSALSEISAVVKVVRENRNRSTAASLSAISRLTVQVLSGAALLGLAIAAAAIWRFHQHDRERDAQFKRLVEAEEGLRALSQRLVEAQEQERKKLSRELHDEVGQVLTALRVQLGQVSANGASSNPHLNQAAELAERSLQTVRQMARGLRPAMLDDLGLGPALKWLARDVSKNTDLEVEMELEGEFAGLDEARRTCVYRVVQEALTNCVKHAEATKARVVVHESPHELVLTVQDNGVGASPEKSRGIGLLGMRERLEEFNGEFSVVSAPGAGMLVRANLPKGRMETT